MRAYRWRFGIEECFMKRSSDSDRRRPVFTLTELLVVMCIIAVLATLLLPTMKAAMMMSKEAYCANNLKSLHEAAHSYCGDYGEKIVAYMMTAPDEVFFHTLLVDGKYMGSSGPQVFSCPANIAGNGSGAPAVFGPGKPNYYYSYGMVLDGPSEDPSTPESVGWSQYLDDDGVPKYVVDAKKCGSPSRQPLFADSVSDDTANGEILYATQVYSIMMGSTRWGATSHHVHGRHGGKADAVFADGHTMPAFATDFKTFLKEDCGYTGQYRFYTDPFPFFVVVGVD